MSLSKQQIEEMYEKDKTLGHREFWQAIFNKVKDPTKKEEVANMAVEELVQIEEALDTASNVVESTLSEAAKRLFHMIPNGGKSIGNFQLHRRMGVGVEISKNDYTTARTELLNAGLITLGRGRGGSVKRV